MAQPEDPIDIDPALNPELDHWSRRSLVKGMGLGAFATAFLGPGALQGKPESLLGNADQTQQMVKIPHDGLEMEAFMAKPKKPGRHGSVIVVHEIFGLNNHIKEIACRLAKAGYTGLAVNFFQRAGEIPDTSDFGKLRELIGKITDEQTMGDVRAAAKYLKKQDDSNGKAGIVGFCYGGNISMLAAGKVKEIDAAVAYYGRVKGAPTPTKPESPFDLADKFTAPVLGHFGALDRAIPFADAVEMRDKAKAAGKVVEVYEYADANHAFNNDTRPSYHPQSAATAWKRTLEWYEKYLG
jgi:carboxymethylenebutenolidase